MLAPVCLFVFNRLAETIRTVEALKMNYLATQTEVFIFSDGPPLGKSEDRVLQVREYIRSVDGFKRVQVFESEENKGLADSIIAGVTKVVAEYGKVIVLEDDLVTMPNFLDFMNQGLEFYRNEKRVQSINGYSFKLDTRGCEVYFQTRPMSWGWATWSRYWNPEIFDKERIKQEIADKNILRGFKLACGRDIPQMLIDSIEGRNNSWYVRWAYNHFRSGHFSVYPRKSLVNNIGFGKDGTHCKGINVYEIEMEDKAKTTFDFVDFRKPDPALSKEYVAYFGYRHKLLFRLKYLKSISGIKLLLSDLVEKINKE